MNHLQLLYIRVQQLKASFVRAQNIAAVWNHCHPWQFWLNDLNDPAGLLKNGLIRLLCGNILARMRSLKYNLFIQDNVEIYMKKLHHFYNTASAVFILALSCFVIFTITGCSKKIGYGVVNWSIPEYNLTASDVVPILVRSNISKVYIAELNNQKIEIPLWQLTFCSSKR